MAFTGKAVYDTGVFDVETAEDVSDIVSIISPHETPFLDMIGDGDFPAENLIHEYMEGALVPSRLYAASTISDTLVTLGLTPAITSGQLMKGTIVENENTGEVILISAFPGSPNVTIQRGFGGTTAATIATAHVLTVISDAALEGADVEQDVSVPRVRKSNRVQLFKKDIIISGTDQAVTLVGGISSELEYQISSRTREGLRDLERASLRGITSAVTIGSSVDVRTMRGLIDFITTNTFAYTPGALGADQINEMFKAAWDNGARDLDLIIAGKDAKEEIDKMLQTERRVIQGQDSRRVERIVDLFESSFGNAQVMLNRWMRPKEIVVTSTRRIKIIPLKGRSFTFQPIAKTGDSTKGMIVGEYTMEVYNQEGMAKTNGTL